MPANRRQLTVVAGPGLRRQRVWGERQVAGLPGCAHQRLPGPAQGGRHRPAGRRALARGHLPLHPQVQLPSGGSPVNFLQVGKDPADGDVHPQLPGGAEAPAGGGGLQG